MYVEKKKVNQPEIGISTYDSLHIKQEKEERYVKSP